MANLDSTGRRGHWLAIAAGPLLALLLVLFADLQPGQPAVTRMAAVALWMAIWWASAARRLAIPSASRSRRALAISAAAEFP